MTQQWKNENYLLTVAQTGGAKSTVTVKKVYLLSSINDFLQVLCIEYREVANFKLDLKKVMFIMSWAWTLWRFHLFQFVSVLEGCCFNVVNKGIFSSVLTVLTYEVYVLTGDKLGAGTKAVVKLTMFGEYGSSGERQLLRSRTHRTKFQRGQVRLKDCRSPYNFPYRKNIVTTQYRIESWCLKLHQIA